MVVLGSTGVSMMTSSSFVREGLGVLVLLMTLGVVFDALGSSVWWVGHQPSALWLWTCHCFIINLTECFKDGIAFLCDLTDNFRCVVWEHFFALIFAIGLNIVQGDGSVEHLSLIDFDTVMGLLALSAESVTLKALDVKMRRNGSIEDEVIHLWDAGLVGTIEEKFKSSDPLLLSHGFSLRQDSRSNSRSAPSFRLLNLYLSFMSIFFLFVVKLGLLHFWSIKLSWEPLVIEIRLLIFECQHGVKLLLSVFWPVLGLPYCILNALKKDGWVVRVPQVQRLVVEIGFQASQLVL